MRPKRDNFHNKRNSGQKFQRRGPPPGPPRKREYRHQDQLTEPEVGITEFFSTLEGFSGIIKARFSDFHVNEINLDGVVAKLTDTSMPKDFVTKVENIDYNTVEVTPIETLPQDKWDAIKNLVQAAEGEPVLLEADNLSKDDRTALHKCIKTHFKQGIVASTILVDDKKFMQFKKFNKNDKIDHRTQWPDDKGEYVHFLVYKEAMDTMEACFKLGDSVGLPPSKFTYAGVKDRRSKSTQWFSVRKVEPWKLLKHTKRMWNLKIGNFTFKDEPLKLGQLKGNKFRIALRNVTGSDELILQSMEHVKSNGFVNYYGLQRFGNDKEVPTYQIGVNLLLAKWKEAVELILKPKSSDDPFDDASKAKKIYSDTGDAAKALQALENVKNKLVEVRLLQGLSKENQNDFVNALENIPRNMRLLYIHSFQSLIWNKMVSKRLQLFGLVPVEGDFVLVNADCDQIEEVAAAATDDDDLVEEPEEIFKCKQEVKALTADELSNYTIYDIVLPLPGYDIIYPENLKEYYKEALEEHGLSLEMTRQKVKTYTLCGNYRKIVERVKNLSWEIFHYDDPVFDFIRSDLQELQGKPAPKDKKDGKYKALVMEFDLAASSYATMVLREVLKTDTSSSAQARLNDYHESSAEKKILIESSSKDGGNDGCDEPEEQSRSLLSNAEKYEAFKNSIFKSIEVLEKRQIEEEVGEGDSGSSKKQKTEIAADDD